VGCGRSSAGGGVGWRSGGGLVAVRGGVSGGTGGASGGVHGRRRGLLDGGLCRRSRGVTRDIMSIFTRKPDGELGN